MVECVWECGKGSPICQKLCPQTFLSYLKNTFVTFQEEILEKRHLCASDKVKNQSFLSLRLQVRRATFQPVLQD